MNPAFLGKWNLDKARSWGGEAFAKALGMPDEQFAMFDKMELALTISKEGGGYKFSFDFKGAAASYVVTVGEPVTVPMLDGTSARLTLTIVGDTVKEKYKTTKFAWTITRTVSGKEQKVVSAAGDAKMTHFFVKE
ncbi:hypothetical protein RRG08_051975 [Elysia crispata]|uniref:Uncharacterized protein n=1 Tax=Elysia crispata TaxID=231223 RepID=A0AAE1DDR7_9GAST|nr:hypothetical protein RRG08_051975 [Elysia crispata]